MPAVMTAMGPCYAHGGLFLFDPVRVQTVLIDPVTRRPPDVAEDGQLIDPPDPGFAERRARSVKQLLCPGCCKKLNEVARQRGMRATFDETDTSDGQVQI